MKLGRRTELLLGALAFSGLAGAFGWQAAVYWRAGSGWKSAAAVGFATLGAATLLATLLFVRARWTPPIPGAPVGRSPDGES